MPELPEVETVRRILEKQVVGKVIHHVDVFYEPMIKTDLQTFKLAVQGQEIVRLERYGKYLVFVLKDVVFIVHLRMEGKFFIKQYEQRDKHEHIIFTFEDGATLRYHDVRKFGTVDVKTHENYLTTHPISSLGPEPKDADPKTVYQTLHHKKVAVKTALLDQHIISGLGNIYVDETLFLSRIKPTRRTDRLTKKEVKTLIESARIVLAKAVKLGGTTIRSYTASLGVTGRFQHELNVHTKVGEPCNVCGTIIIKTKVGGRGTYACPTCQK